MKNISKMKKTKLLLLLILLINSLQLFSQNKYQLSIGTSLSDNISNNYLKPGIYAAYGIDFNISNHLTINTDISICYNDKNVSYRYGLDDDPYFIDHPYERERHASDLPNSFPLYLFNSSIALNFKYLIIPKKTVSPYLLIGISGNYSLSKDPVIKYEFNNEGWIWTFGISGGELEQQFNIGYQAGIGLNYNIKNNKSIFIESQYKLQPNVKFGVNNDRVGLFIISAGISFPFK